jgi:hypothetical protein
MNIIHCAGFRVTQAARRGGDLFAVAIKFNDVTYGVVSSPDTFENTTKILGQKGQVILRWPQGFDADGEEYRRWGAAGWSQFGFNFDPTNTLTGTSPNFKRKMYGFNLTPTQEAYWTSRGLLISNTQFPVTTTLGASQLIQSGFPSSNIFVNGALNGFIQFIDAIGAVKRVPFGVAGNTFADQYYNSNGQWRNSQEATSSSVGTGGGGTFFSAHVMGPNDPFMIGSGTAFQWVIP